MTIFGGFEIGGNRLCHAWTNVEATSSSPSILWTWTDFFIVHFMEYNRDVDVGEQDINPPRLAF